MVRLDSCLGDYGRIDVGDLVHVLVPHALSLHCHDRMVSSVIISLLLLCIMNCVICNCILKLDYAKKGGLIYL